MQRLLSHDKCPPGEFRYEQSFNGKSKKFGSHPVISELAKKVSDFRKGNALPRPSQGEALEDIDFWNAQRLGFDPRWCYDTDRPFSELVAMSPSADCATCGK